MSVHLHNVEYWQFILEIVYLLIFCACCSTHSPRFNSKFEKKKNLVFEKKNSSKKKSRFFWFENGLQCAWNKMTEEVCAKRMKLDPTASIGSSDTNLRETCTVTAILSNEFYEPIQQCFVYVATISDFKAMSKIMSELCQLMPLNELNHLKRVNKSKLILCSLNNIKQFLQQQHHHQEDRPEFLSNFPTESNEEDLKKASEHFTISLLRFYMESREIAQNIVELLSEKIEIVPVSASLPVLSWQYKDISRIWPCKFHPNKDLEKLYTGTWFTKAETTFHIQMIEICGFLRKELNKSVSGIAVDPRTKSIVAIGFDEIGRHPLMHCAMVLIDSVARSQNGGAWNDILLENDDESQAIYTNDSTEYTLSGVSPFIRKLISSQFASVTFGAERIKTAAENRQNDLEMSANANNLAKYGPYLCTGYDVYLSREPCVMCSMALTHSRIRTIFFHEKQPNGAICSLVKLQSVKALNHHFQVFHIDGDFNVKWFRWNFIKYFFLYWIYVIWDEKKTYKIKMIWISHW